MPSFHLTKVEVGQVWSRDVDTWEYEIISVSDCGDVYAAWHLKGLIYYSKRYFGTVKSDRLPTWCTSENSPWKIVRFIKPPICSKISASYLRKRVRDQLAAQALTKPII